MRLQCGGVVCHTPAIADMRLAIIQSHPTQYFSPWFRHLAADPRVTVKVFYLWDFGVKETVDIVFQKSFVWDIPLLDGYDSVFIPNVSSDPGTHHFTGLNNPKAARMIADWQPDRILIFGYGYVTHLRLILAPELMKIPLLFRGDSHELYPKKNLNSKLGEFLRRVIFRRFSAFLAVGRANTAYFRRVGVPEHKIYFSPHCVDNERFQNASSSAEQEAQVWKNQLGIPPASPVVLFAGKFETKKCPVDLLRTFLSLPNPANGEPKPVILFVGSGPLAVELRRTAGDAIGKTVFFAPFQNQSAMPKVYATGDLLVLPSYGRGETWGLVVNEAMNLARPAIVSSHCGCSLDLIVQGKTGWVFPAGDWDALRNTLVEALRDSDRLRQSGIQAREHIDGYSFEKAGKGLMDALVQVVPASR